MPDIFPPLYNETDTDGDNIVDCIDDCPDIPNPDQNGCLPPDLELGRKCRDANAGQQYVGNPINIFNGNNTETEVDITFSTPFEGGLNLIRHYNSQSLDSSSMGYGWRHNYHVSLSRGDSGDMNQVRIVDQTGRGIYFEFSEPDQIFKGKYTETTSV